MIRGTYFDGRTSRARTVEVRFGSATIRVQGLDETLEIPIGSVSVSDALGETDRSILLEDGARIDLPDSPELDRIGGRRDPFSLVHMLERDWKFALLAVVLVIGVVWGIVTVAVPIAAKQMSVAVPATLRETISHQALTYLDNNFFEPSTLHPQVQADISSVFQQVVAYEGGEYPYRLEFRDGGPLGANALALPSGVVIVTDDLVDLSHDPEELAGVLAHEIGHVVNRHSVRLLLQSSATAILVATFTGDLSFLSALATSLPTLLVQSGYSRNFEREADAFAYAYLDHANIPAEQFTGLLERLEDSHGGSIEGILSYLSTHPPASERTERPSE